MSTSTDLFDDLSDSPLLERVVPAAGAPPARSRPRARNPFRTFSLWAIAWHLGLAVGLVAAPELARACLLPVSHLFAWAVLVGSHVLVGAYPETMHAPRIDGHAHLHGKSLTILVGHELLHVLPVVALYVVPGVWPAHGTLSAASWLLASLPGLALGGLYLALYGGPNNAYGASPAALRAMTLGAAGAGVLANLAALWRL